MFIILLHNAYNEDFTTLRKLSTNWIREITINIRISQIDGLTRVILQYPGEHVVLSKIIVRTTCKAVQTHQIFKGGDLTINPATSAIVLGITLCGSLSKEGGEVGEIEVTKNYVEVITGFRRSEGKERSSAIIEEELHSIVTELIIILLIDNYHHHHIQCAIYTLHG